MTPRIVFWPGLFLGFAMGGFFDGILLHQILQWHHLFSALESDPFRDLRTQIMADGLFHALMYVILTFGLWGLWRAHRRGRIDSGRGLIAAFLTGFGVWHLVDGLISHGLLGIHRIRPESDHPLFWDLLFFIGLGLLPVLTGFLLRRAAGKGGYQTVALLLALGVGTAAAFAAIPWRNARAVAVIFKPGATPDEVFAAASAVDARLMWNNDTGDVWLFHIADPQSAWRLYRHGAWFVSGSFFGTGCFIPPSHAL